MNEVVLTEGQVRESVAVARSHGEKFFEQIIWQIENEVWHVLGHASWDSMRVAEYGDMGVVVPRADRPELVSRMRAKGHTQQSIANTLGVSDRTVREDLSTGEFPVEDAAPITNIRGQERPATYKRTETTTVSESVAADPETGEVLGDETQYTRPEPKAERRRALTESARDAGWNIRKATEKLQRIHEDDRFSRNKEEMATLLRSHIQFVIETCQGFLDDFDQ